MAWRVRADEVGKKYGRLLVIAYSHTEEKEKRAVWKCSCDCGKTVLVIGRLLRNKHTKSCGCLHNEWNANHPVLHATHRLSGSQFYKKYQAMHNRIKSKIPQVVNNYKNRGIKVCRRWHKFENFRDDMHQSYLVHLKKYGERNTCLERINNNKGYSPSNCKWATYKEQAINRRSTRFIKYQGKKLTMTDLSKKLGVSLQLLKYRLDNWPLKKVLIATNHQ